MIDDTEARANADARAHVLNLLGGKWLAGATSAAAMLGLPRILADGPRALDEIVAELDCDRNSLERLLFVLVGANLLVRARDGGYGLTAAGRILDESDLGPLAIYTGSDFNWAPWSRLAQGVKEGRSAFELHHGTNLFDLLAKDEAASTIYNAAVDSFTAREAASVAEAFDFSKVERVVDVGGGQGAFLAGLLKRWTEVRAELLELPAVAGEARRRFEAAGVADRVDIHVGDFFDTMPKDADVYMIKHVIHCLDDETSRALLRRCVEAARDDSTFLIVEGLRLPPSSLDQTGLMDLEMLVLHRVGRERSKPEMRRLLQSAGLRLVRSPALEGGSRLLVAERDGGTNG